MRHGCSRRRRSPRPQSTRRYEWSEPAALLHIDAFTLPKFEQPGHWARDIPPARHATLAHGLAESTI